jgi:hypothetical protein
MDAPLTLLKLENVGALQKLIKMETTYPEKVFTDCVKRSVPTINQLLTLMDNVLVEKSAGQPYNVHRNSPKPRI